MRGQSIQVLEKDRAMTMFVRCRRWKIGPFIQMGMVALFVSLLPIMSPAQDNLPSLIAIIDPYPAGGLGDILPRSLANVLSEQTGHTFIIENKPGATQMIGTQAAAWAAHDGSVILFGSVTSLAINPSIRKHLPYDPIKDFEPISLTFVTPMYLVVRRDLPISSVQELIALAKSEPGKLTYASGGIGSSTHLAGELFKSLTGTSMLHVPYSGTGPAVLDVIAGRVDMMFTASGLANARAKTVKVLAVTSATRVEAAPNLPTIMESGVPGYDATIWFGFLAPAHTPEPIVKRLSAEIKKAVDSGSVLKNLKSSGEDVELVGSTPEEFKAFIAAEIPKWRQVIEAAQIPSK
jgi:tripartite-type tricarboxylate transporter receptor subunit TctC